MHSNWNKQWMLGLYEPEEEFDLYSVFDLLYVTPDRGAVNRRTAAMSQARGMMSRSHISCNPFAIRTSTRCLADSTETKDSSATGSVDTPSASKFILRPSSLTIQTGNPTHSSYGGATQSVEKDICESSCSSSLCGHSTLSVRNGKSEQHSLELDSSDPSASPVVKRPKFVDSPLGLAVGSSSESSSSSFVFGQNIHERVLNFETHNSDSLSDDKLRSLTFHDAALKEGKVEGETKKSLSESAREYESKQVKRKFEEVEVVTGEEEESNVLQVNCKLFAFDKVKVWQEKGRGILRLNDKVCDGVLHSRVVMRTHGSLRVILNSKVWPGMSVDLAGEKAVRLTAVDPDGVKVYLVVALPKDAEQLFSALDCRIKMLKQMEGSTAKGGSSELCVEEATSSSSLPSSDGFTEPEGKRFCHSSRNGNEPDSSTEAKLATDSADGADCGTSHDSALATSTC